MKSVETVRTGWKKELVMALLVSLLGLGAAYSQTDPSASGRIKDGPQVEIFASSQLVSDIIASDFLGTENDLNFGVRGAFHISKRFALEGSAARLGNYDLWLADLSAKFYLKNRGRTSVYILGGPGTIFDPKFNQAETTVHLGLGLEVLAGRHLYVRPEVRGRGLARYPGRATDLDLSLAVGWQF